MLPIPSGSSTLNSTLKSLKHILSQHSNSRTPTRSSRSILPIVGQLSKTLFGLATEDDVQLLARHIYSIEKGREESKQAFAKYQQKLNSELYMTTANQRITNIVAATTDNYKVLRVLARKLTTFSNSASVSTIARRYGPRTIRTTADTAHCGDRQRYETAIPATFSEVPTRAPPPSHRGAWLAVTDTPPTTVMTQI